MGNEIVGRTDHEVDMIPIFEGPGGKDIISPKSIDVGSVRIGAAELAVHSICLLYTSDAADE